MSHRRWPKKAGSAVGDGGPSHRIEWALRVEQNEHELRIRLAAFTFLDEATQRHGEVLEWRLLATGFQYLGTRVCLIGQSGIWKPKQMTVPLTIRTAPITAGRSRPYEDSMDASGFLVYKYRGTNAEHRDNVGLRETMIRRLPLIYMFGVSKGNYLPVWPVYIVSDDTSHLEFRVAGDENRPREDQRQQDTPGIAEARRAYVTQITRRRIHQATFRDKVMRAYRGHCAMCRLKHEELLDAAHIVPDSHPLGEPVVANGVALCKLHHAAFDRHIVGIRPDLVLEVRRDILLEHDGPMLRHGLQELDGLKLPVVPRRADTRPGQEFLELRYGKFRRAS